MKVAPPGNVLVVPAVAPAAVPDGMRDAKLKEAGAAPVVLLAPPKLKGLGDVVSVGWVGLAPNPPNPPKAPNDVPPSAGVEAAAPPKRLPPPPKADEVAPNCDPNPPKAEGAAGVVTPNAPGVPACPRPCCWGCPGAPGVVAGAPNSEEPAEV